jgi:hypothetical protein
VQTAAVHQHNGGSALLTPRQMMELQIAAIDVVAARSCCFHKGRE